jgi:hypothetical protein
MARVGHGSLMVMAYLISVDQFDQRGLEGKWPELLVMTPLIIASLISVDQFDQRGLEGKWPELLVMVPLFIGSLRYVSISLIREASRENGQGC